jgi:hypothetical protein
MVASWATSQDSFQWWNCDYISSSFQGDIHCIDLLYYNIQAHGSLNIHILPLSRSLRSDFIWLRGMDSRWLWRVSSCYIWALPPSYHLPILHYFNPIWEEIDNNQLIIILFLKSFILFIINLIINITYQSKFCNNTLATCHHFLVFFLFSIFTSNISSILPKLLINRSYSNSFMNLVFFFFILDHKT